MAIFSYQENISKYSQNTLYFKASTSIKNVKNAIEIMKKSKTPIRTIIVNSGGGDIRGGMQLGKYIYNNKLNLIVDKNCYSSCANYLFTAAVTKIVNADSEVGWHGGTMQPDWKFPQNIPEEQKQLFYKELILLKQEEKNFFKHINVNQKITYLATIPPYRKQRTSKDCWTYRIKDLKGFGVKNVSFIKNRIYHECDLLVLDKSE